MPYSALYAFGDSLSDAGNVSVLTRLTGQAPVSPPYFKQAYPGGTGTVFSNGPVAVQSLSGQLGLGLLAPSLLGGTDYAYGGAETGDTPQNSGDLRQPLLSLPFQLKQFEAVGLFGNSPAKDALYTLSIGGNDILSILADTSLSVAQQARDVAAAVANESAAVLRLAADGARNLLVFSVPDLGRIPEVTFGLADGSDRPNAATNVRASALAASYNNQLAVALSALPFKVPWRHQVFLGWAGLRGAVPIVLATVPVRTGVPGGTRVLDTVFVLVVVYTLVQAPTLPWVGRRLGVVEDLGATDLEVESAPLDEMRADLLQVEVREGSHLHGVYVDELRLPAGAALTLVVRGGQSTVPGPDTRLQRGDSLLVIATTDSRRAAEERLRAVSRDGKLARWYAVPVVTRASSVPWLESESVSSAEPP